MSLYNWSKVVILLPLCVPSADKAHMSFIRQRMLNFTGHQGPYNCFKTYVVKLLNPNNSNLRPAVQWYFPYSECCSLCQSWNPSILFFCLLGWLEASFQEELDTGNPRHEEHARVLVIELVQQLEAKAAEADDFLTKNKLDQIVENFKVRIFALNHWDRSYNKESCLLIWPPSSG